MIVLELHNFILLTTVIVASLTAVYLYIPVRSLLRSKLSPDEVVRAHDFNTPVSVIIAAYNEEKYLKSKIEYFLNESGFVSGSEIIIISAGSTDYTNSILQEYVNHTNVHSVIIEQHLSKPQALNIAVEKSKNEILVFSDCRQKISAGALWDL